MPGYRVGPGMDALSASPAPAGPVVRSGGRRNREAAKLQVMPGFARGKARKGS